MKWKHLVGLAFGILLMALGLFWFLQGADLIRVDPILCVADCEPLVGGSVQWQLQGVLAFAMGAVLALFSFRRGRRTS